MTRQDEHWKPCWWAVPVVLVSLAVPKAVSGGTPEEALLIVDPQRTDSMYIGNYYLDAREIPAANVLYMDPTASDYYVFAEDNLDALDGSLANARIAEHIHYVIMPPASKYDVSIDSSLIYDGCYPVSALSLSSAYTLRFIKSAILGGSLVSTRPNRYFGLDNRPLAFDSQIKWRDGEPSGDNGQRYYIGACLGYVSERGNSLDETIAMIDRSVAVDGTRPAGTFYYMETTDSARSDPRDFYFPTAVADLLALGGSAEHLLAVLPEGRHDCTGIMTGWAGPDIDGADMTILPGAICDHMTSYAGVLSGSGSQTSMARWIVKGASGTWGTVQEPCNYAGKFPHARAHVYYFQGLSLGESIFRSVGFLPFQGLLYGDPLTRPFAYLPEVEVADAPSGTVSGSITLTPTATTTHPTAAIARFDLLIDGVIHSTVVPGEQFAVDTPDLSDGWHDLRVIAYDDLDQRFTGRWIGEMIADNRARAATLDVTPSSGNWTTAFTATLGSTGTDVAEVRLLHNSRVVAAANGASAELTVYGLTLGAGPVRVQTEALFADGERVRSAPFALQIDYDGDTPSGDPPVAFDCTRHVLADQPFVVELPATFDDPDTPLTYSLLSDPLQSTVVASSGPYRLMRPDPLADGTDPFTFQVTSAAGASNVATVTLVYISCIGDLNGDGRIDLADLAQLLANYGTASGMTYEDGDIDGDGDVDLSDLAALLAHYGDICHW